MDAAIINSDALEQFKTLVPNIHQRITYILSLFPSELHIFVRPEINSLDDLKGKKVNFNTPGTAAAYSGPLIFEQLKLDVRRPSSPPGCAGADEGGTGRHGSGRVHHIQADRRVSRAASGTAGFKFLPVPFEDFGFYLPSTLTASDYPDLIPQGQRIRDHRSPTILAAFNWPKEYGPL